MTLLEMLRDALARVVSARDLLDEGDNWTAEQVLYELEVDLAGAIDISAPYGGAA